MTLHQCDVSKEVDVNRLRDEVTVAHGNAINLVFNNAGIGGGGTMTSEETREEWERTLEVAGMVSTIPVVLMSHVIASTKVGS